MIQEFIVLQGARENNLKNISLRISKRKITIFTGISGSGKSSIYHNRSLPRLQRHTFESKEPQLQDQRPQYRRTRCHGSRRPHQRYPRI
jgi:excinuclease UvrABC ATPase subunit